MAKKNEKPDAKKTASRKKTARKKSKARPARSLLEILGVADAADVDEGALSKLTVTRLREAARELALETVSRLRKAELVKRVAGALAGARNEEAPPRPKPPRSPARHPAAAAPAPVPAPSPAPAPVEIDRDLPWTYGADRIGAMPVDPHRLFVYWDVTDPSIEAARETLAAASASLVLRVYDTTGRLFDGTNARHHQDQTVDRETRQWYLDVGEPGSEAYVEIGVRDDGRYQKIARSRRVVFPRLAPAARREPEWLTVQGPRERTEQALPPGTETELPAVREPSAPPPQAHPAPPRVEEHHEGRFETRRIEGRAHVVFGPWEISVHGTEPRGSREVVRSWTLYRSWIVGGGRFVEAYPGPIAPGSSERMGASERRWLSASELRLGGASERFGFGLGASERRLGGASERLRPGFPSTAEDRSSGR